MKTLRLGLLFLTLTLICSCGAESSGTYNPTSDTVTTTGLVTFDSSTIQVVTKGPTVQSEIIEECTIGFDKEELSYELKSNDELVLGGQTFEYLRPLATASSAKGIDSRLFAVWRLPSQTVGQVTYTLEVEIRNDSIIYSNTCTR